MFTILHVLHTVGYVWIYLHKHSVIIKTMVIMDMDLVSTAC